MRLFKGSQLAKGLVKIKDSVLGAGGRSSQIEDLNVMLETLGQVQIASKEINLVCLDLI